jgi:hypothetical protein
MERERNPNKTKGEIHMKNNNFEKIFVGRGCGTEEYRVKNCEGMTEAEIINACDRNNFGGRVCGNLVTVYID